jgi:aryl-alcohol dehydrogenase-like predicted oxidoreductase
VHAAGTITLGELTVHRLGFGAMRLTGRGIWGEPADRQECLRVLRRTVELGIDLIDTADSYGPYVSEDLIREALHPYPNQLVIATKAGLVRTGPGRWDAVGRPEYLRQEVEMSLRRLQQERIDLFQLHRIDPLVPAEEQFGLLADLIAEGKVRHVGLSNVTEGDLVQARRTVPIVTVQNRYNLTDRTSEPVLEYCQANQIGFVPWNPIAAGELARPGGPVGDIARHTGATPSQVALAWLLARSQVMMPIPGTASVAHLEENCAATNVRLSADQVEQLTAATPPGAGPE